MGERYSSQRADMVRAENIRNHVALPLIKKHTADHGGIMAGEVARQLNINRKTGLNYCERLRRAGKIERVYPEGFLVGNNPPREIHAYRSI